MPPLDPRDPPATPFQPNYLQAFHLGATVICICLLAAAFPIVIVCESFRIDELPVLLLVALPALALGLLTTFGNLRLQRDRERRAHGCCIECGYDLRASAGHRCPECGTRLRR